MGDQSLKMLLFGEGEASLPVGYRRWSSIHPTFIVGLLLSLFLSAAVIGQDDSASAIPVNELGAESVDGQDPDSEDQQPQDPDEQLHQDVIGYFASQQSADWVRALTLLGARIEAGKHPQYIPYIEKKIGGKY